MGNNMESLQERYFPLDWEEQWRREKERRKKAIEDGGEERIKQDRNELRRIVAYNDTRMGLLSRAHEREGPNVKMSGTSQEALGDSTSKEALGNEGPGHKYRSATYAKDVFMALKMFRDSFVLTDLTLIASSNESIEVHATILAAVSSYIQEKLIDEGNERADNDSDVNVRRKTLALGTEVDHTGLQAVVEFAYTGTVLSLNKDSIVSTKAAAQTLGVPRLVELCDKHDKFREVGSSPTKEEPEVQSAHQMNITLQSINHLWANRMRCDVTLELDGTSFHGRYSVIFLKSSLQESYFNSNLNTSFVCFQFTKLFWLQAVTTSVACSPVE